MTVTERFWRLVSKTETCWLFGRAGTERGGYAHFFDGVRRVLAHRYSAQLAGLVIPPGMDVCHSCEGTNCVRPSHLYVATHRQNIRDMYASRHARGLRRRSPPPTYPITSALRWCAGFSESEAS